MKGWCLFVFQWLIHGTLGDLQDILQRECFLKVPANYSKALPPEILNKRGEKQPLEVFVTFGGSEIEYIKEENQRIHMTILYEEKWNDPRIFELGEGQNN